MTYRQGWFLSKMQKTQSLETARPDTTWVLSVPPLKVAQGKGGHQPPLLPNSKSPCQETIQNLL